MKKLLLIVIAVLALAVPFVAQAQAERTPVPNPIIITEDQVNESFFVTNPPTRRWENLAVDLQEDQVTITGDLTLRARRGDSPNTYAVEAVITVSVTNGRVTWALDSATVSGAAASQEVIDAINASVTSSFRNYVRSNIRSGRVTSITITEDDLQIAWQ